MASVISAGTTSGTSLNLSGDTSGVLQLASNGSTTAVTIDTNQRAAFVAGTAALPAITTTGDTNTGIFFPAADTIAFTEGGTESMRITSAGDVCIGTTSVAGNQQALVVRSADNAGKLTGTFICTSSSSTAYGIEVNYSALAPNNTGSEFYIASDSSATRFQVRSNGGIANYSGNNVNLSDAKEKTNVELAGNYLDKICAIPVKTFNYIDQNFETDDGTTLGVIAQDVQAVAPELVTESNWAKIGEETKMRFSIYQTDLQYALMKCIQELNAKVEAQAVRIAELEGAR
jgi:hypothetical protein